jgi:hypothetical protein
MFMYSWWNTVLTYSGSSCFLPPRQADIEEVRKESGEGKFRTDPRAITVNIS